MKSPAVVERRFELQPLPQLGAADFGRRRVLHQIVERHRAAPAEPGGDILDGDADILARAGFGARAGVQLQHLVAAGDAVGDLRQLVRAVHRRERLQRDRHQRRVGDPGAVMAVADFAQLVGADLVQRRRLAASSPLTGMKADMPPMAKAPRRWQVAIRRSE